MTTIYTDGALSVGNGGWAWWVDDSHWDAGAERDTTNNRMEMMAVIKALEWAHDRFDPHEPIMIVSDSAYVVNCFADRWYIGWRNRGWINSNKKPVVNRDLWERMLDLYETYGSGITFRHCRGHGKGGAADAPHVYGNDKADRLAVAARLTLER